MREQDNLQFIWQTGSNKHNNKVDHTKEKEREGGKEHQKYQSDTNITMRDYCVILCALVCSMRWQIQAKHKAKTVIKQLIGRNGIDRWYWAAIKQISDIDKQINKQTKMKMGAITANWPSYIYSNSLATSGSSNPFSIKWARMTTALVAFKMPWVFSISVAQLKWVKIGRLFWRFLARNCCFT